MTAIDLTRILKPYKSGWVSISKDHKKVVTSARSIDVLVKKLKKLGNPRGFIMKAAPDYSRYVG